jgi:16S rRNA (cytosine967-C5)-methyltransferase
MPKAEILATDASARRLERMRSRLKDYPYATGVRVEAADAMEPSADLGRFDLILCDVPCSGTGTLARNPEIRHRLMPEDLARHSARQRKLLSAALGRLAAGGRLLYSTCSLEPEECERVVENVATERKAQVIPIAPILNGLLSMGALRESLDGAILGDFLRTLPGTHPFDGFFAALFERQ